MEEDLKRLIKKCDECKLNECINCEISYSDIQTIKHLIKAYKELKEIEESHRKENGKLRERVKELEEEIMQKDLEIIGAEEYTKASMGEIIEHYYTANEKCIPVSLVKEKIEELNKRIDYLKIELNKCYIEREKLGTETDIDNNETAIFYMEEEKDYIYKQKDILKELLEGRK